MKHHSHSFSGMTSYNQGHIHHYGGVTTKAESGVPHTHHIEEVTTYHDDHEHYYDTNTGPAIYLLSGLHYHLFEAKVQLADNHIHYIYGYTSLD